MHTIVESMSTLTESANTALQLTFSADPALWTIVGRSLSVSATACLLACGAGLVLGAWLGVARFAGRGAVLAVLNTLLAVPSVVVGLVVYLLLSRSGPLGSWGWLFSFKAMVLAQAILVLPVVTALVRQVVADAERQHGRQSEEISNQSDHVSATGSASGFARRDELRTPCGVLHVMRWMARHADFTCKAGRFEIAHLCVTYIGVTETM